MTKDTFITKCNQIGISINGQCCLYCKRNKMLIYDCEHIICVECDYKTNVYGCCAICIARRPL